MIAAAPPPPPTIVAAVKSVYPRSPVTVARVCRVDGLALVAIHRRARKPYVAVQRERRGWRAVWIDGTVARSVPAGSRASVAADVARLRTRCLAP